MFTSHPRFLVTRALYFALVACSRGEFDLPQQPPTVVVAEDQIFSSSSGATDSGGSSTTVGPGRAEAITSTGGYDGGASSESSGAPFCDGPCVPVGPLEWQGPVVVFGSSAVDPAPACPGGAEPVMEELFTDLVGTEFSCKCECGPAEELACDPHGRLERYAESDCTGEVLEQTQVVAGVCSRVSRAPGVWRLVPPEMLTGSCPAIARHEISEPSFVRRWIACNAQPDEEDCGPDEVCPGREAASAPRRCMWTDGKHECTMPGFAHQQVVFRGLIDDRSCGDCRCSDPIDACAAARVFAYRGQGSCGSPQSPLAGFASAGSCIGLPSMGLLYQPSPGREVTCDALAPEPEGGVTPANALTLCCDQPPPSLPDATSEPR